MNFRTKENENLKDKIKATEGKGTGMNILNVFLLHYNNII